jgi:formate dehydrogenase major subunit
MGRQALDAPGDARADWWITQEIARRMGLDWRYGGPADVFAEMKLAMPSLENITWERLERESAVTYPCPAPDQPGQEIVFADRFPTTTGLGLMVPAEILPPDEQPDRDYPFVLSTGRQLEHWHTGAMTRRATNLHALEPEATAQMNAADIARLGLEAGDQVRVSTRRGAITIKLRADNNVSPGAIYIPFAYVEAAANLLTNPKLDPFGKIPEFKFCAARVEPIRGGQLAAAE